MTTHNRATFELLIRKAGMKCPLIVPADTMTLLVGAIRLYQSHGWWAESVWLPNEQRYLVARYQDTDKLAEDFENGTP